MSTSQNHPAYFDLDHIQEENLIVRLSVGMKHDQLLMTIDRHSNDFSITHELFMFG